MHLFCGRLPVPALPTCCSADFIQPSSQALFVPSHRVLTSVLTQY